MERPLVSVVIPCHNRRDYLKLTLESVLAQTYRPIEIVVVDDGSTDGTGEMIKSCFGDRVRYIWQASQGVAVARTRASRLARGEYIAYQDDDDLMPAERIENLMGVLLRYPQAVLATGDFALIDRDGNLTGHRWLSGSLDYRGAPQLLEDGRAAILWPRVPAVPHTTLFRREHGEAIGWFDPDFRYACSDADFLARLAAMGPIVYLPQVVSYYRRGHAAIWADDIRTTCSQIQLWLKHLREIGNSNPQLSRRLHERIRIALVRLTQAKPGATAQQRGDIRFWRSAGLAQLGIAERIRVLFEGHLKIAARALRASFRN